MLKCNKFSEAGIRRSGWGSWGAPLGQTTWEKIMIGLITKNSPKKYYFLVFNLAPNYSENVNNRIIMKVQTCFLILYRLCCRTAVRTVWRVASLPRENLSASPPKISKMVQKNSPPCVILGTLYIRYIRKTYPYVKLAALQSWHQSDIRLLVIDYRHHWHRDYIWIN